MQTLLLCAYLPLLPSHCTRIYRSLSGPIDCFTLSSISHTSHTSLHTYNFETIENVLKILNIFWLIYIFMFRTRISFSGLIGDPFALHEVELFLSSFFFFSLQYQSPFSHQLESISNRFLSQFDDYYSYFWFFFFYMLWVWVLPAVKWILGRLKRDGRMWIVVDDRRDKQLDKTSKK